MGTTESGSDPESSSNGWSWARGLVIKTLVLVGGALLIKRLTKSTTRRDHARVVSRSLTGEKFTREQASRDPDNYFNIRCLLKTTTTTCLKKSLKEKKKNLDNVLQLVDLKGKKAAQLLNQPLILLR
ncbi:PREDICTED: chromophore lyase CRL, chloroplastic-like [Camelina sativa]|uniref:Chromophore lyase CRL, chloroplastic-like n=1 Tax=Camelina sativa TaxID=90675 RepID=A0ABM0X8W3_CAMSA|nr:PREDICTED: chromophore lyase CRL, chloroplastic-like [Camelina sativa]